MRTYYTKHLIAATLLSLCVSVSGQTPTPSPTPFVAPPLPEIVNFEKPNVSSVDPAKLPPPFHTESAPAGFACDTAACLSKVVCSNGI